MLGYSRGWDAGTVVVQTPISYSRLFVYNNATFLSGHMVFCIGFTAH